MVLMYLAADKVPGSYEEQKLSTDMESRAMQGETIGVTCAYLTRKTKRFAEAVLEFLPLLGSDAEIEPRPQIFLHSDETTKAESQWGPRNSSEQRIVIAPGGDFQKNAGATKTSPIYQIFF